MSRLKKNIIANISGNAWAAAISLLLIPVHINILGVERFGLISIYATLTVIARLFDFGFSTTVEREIARLNIDSSKNKNAIASIIRTLELLYWSVSLVISLALFLLAYWIAVYWLQSNSLPVDELKIGIQLMALSLFVQWPSTFYASVLSGFQRQVPINIFLILFTTIRVAGVIPILLYIQNDTQTYFIWNIVIFLFHVIFLRLTIRCYTNVGSLGKRYDFRKIWTLRSFAGFVAGAAVCGVIHSQLDRIVLSKILPLETFAYYALAWVAASGLSRLVGPLIIAVYPRFAELLAEENDQGLKETFHSIIQLLIFITLPIASLIAFNSWDVIYLWTQNADLADNTSTLLVLLICSVFFNSMTHPITSLQYAKGHSKLIFWWAVVGLLFLAGLLYPLGVYRGGIGVASAMLAQSVLFFVILVEIAFKNVLAEEKRLFYLNDIIYPLLVIVTISAVLNYLKPGVANIPYLIITLAITQVAALFVLPSVKKRVMSFLPTRILGA